MPTWLRSVEPTCSRSCCAAPGVVALASTWTLLPRVALQHALRAPLLLLQAAPLLSRLLLSLLAALLPLLRSALPLSTEV